MNRYHPIGKELRVLKKFRFTKADRIRKQIEYEMLSKKGKRCFSDFFIVITCKNQLSRSRLGITVSRKVGKAVTRNRIKRIIREYFRLNRHLLSGHLDINIVARQTIGKAGASVIRNHLRDCFERIAGKTQLTGR